MCSRLLGLVVLWILAVSCTILENRRDCPCQLDLDLSGESCGVYDTLAVMVRGASFVFEEEVPRSKFASLYPVMVAERSVVSLAVVPKNFASLWKDGRCCAVVGKPFPALYSFHAKVDCAPSYQSQTVQIHKNHCILNLRFTDPQDYDYVLRSNTAGIETGGSCAFGEFFLPLFPDAAGECRACIPRQGDDSLVLEISDAVGVKRSFALGNIIAQSGYDWAAEDLQDIFLTIDYSAMSVKLRLSLWDREIFVPIVV